MTTLPDMLRKTANQEFGTYNVSDDSVRIGCGSLRDAADEIERFGAEVQHLIEVANVISRNKESLVKALHEIAFMDEFMDSHTAKKMMNIAREALRKVQ